MNPIDRILGLPRLPLHDPTSRPDYEQLTDHLLASSEQVRLPSDITSYLRWLATHHNVLFHGSQRDDITELRPDRESSDSTTFGDQRAVFATDDPVWAMWFALMTRGPAFRSTRNGAWKIRGSRHRHYFFSVDTNLPDGEVLTNGWLYVLPRSGFVPEPPVAGLLQSSQWVSPAPVRPLARVPVPPADFPFAKSVGRHTRSDSMLHTLRTARATYRRLTHDPSKTAHRGPDRPV